MDLFAYPMPPLQQSTLPSLAGTTFVIDAAAEKAALIAHATAAKNLHKIHVRTGTVATGDTVDVRVETMSGVDPSGTLWATNTNAALVIGSGDDNVWKEATLTADATLALGDVFAIVIVNGGAGGNIQIAAVSDAAPSAGGQFPYGSLFTSAWATTGVLPLIFLEFSDGSFSPIFGFVDSGGPITTNTINTGTSTTRAGNLFAPPCPMKALGAWVWCDADGDFTVKLYDTNGTSVLATTPTINTLQRQATTAGLHHVVFTTQPTLAMGSSYRLVVVPDGVTSMTTYQFDVPTAAAMEMFPGGTGMYSSLFTSSAWVEVTTRRTWMGVYGAYEAPAAGGGGENTVMFIPMD